MPNQNHAASKPAIVAATQRTALVLGGTGRTGTLVARTLAERGMNSRTASRGAAHVVFDWDDRGTYAPALNGVDRIYLVAPVVRAKFADQVADFLDRAERAAVRHVTYLSTHGSDRSPPEVDIRTVELDLARRRSFTYSILRPAWVMQNFSDEHLPLIDGVITVPTGGGTEAFVDAADIAAVAVETLIDPEAHSSAEYTPTGPQSLTISEVAGIIAGVIGRPVVHNDIDPDVWINGAVDAGFVPADYAIMLRWLTGTIISGNGSQPNDDIQKVTGRPATSFEEFARRNAAAWTLGGGQVTPRL